MNAATDATDTRQFRQWATGWAAKTAAAVHLHTVALTSRSLP